MSSKSSLKGEAIDGFALSIGERVTLVSGKKQGKRRKKGVVMFSYQSDSYELYQVKWDGEYSDPLPWYSPDELRVIGKGSTTVKAVKSKRRKRWWDDIDWGSGSSRYKWRSDVEKVDELLTELTTPPADTKQHVL